MTLQEDGRSRYAETQTALIGAMQPAGWRLSWGAVFAGVIVALVAHILLNLLGIGIGAAGVDPATSTAEDAGTMGIVAGIWWSVAGIVAAGLGGWIAGRTMGVSDPDDGLIHGILTWAVTTLVIAFVLTSVMGGALAGAMGRLGNQMGIPLPAPSASVQQSPAPSAQGQAPQATQPSAQAPKAPDARTVSRAVAGSALASFFALLFGAIAAGLAGRHGVAAARAALQNAD